MADEQIVTSIVAKADLSSLVSEVHRASASLQQLQRELLASNKAISSSTKLANNLFRDTLTGSGQFSSHFVNLNSDVDKFGKNLDSGRLKLKNYFQTFREHATTQKGMIRELAKEQVMLQNSVLQPLGRNAQGLMQYNVMIPRGLDAVKNSAQLARMELQIMNRALSEGAGSLINWGKNTQWAGRQLTVGLTVPLTMFGAAAGKAFREADQELVRLTKVYGGLAATSASDLKAIREEVVQTAKTLSQTMGASFKDTIALGADIAATGKMGNDLLGSIEETTRLSILGEVDRQDAMKATLSIQTAFKQNTEQLTESINFLNAVENQTSTTLNDLVEAIPKAGPVIQQLGGSIEDLALYMTAMREGGINASEGANALKSGLASLINPTKQTVGMMSDFGIDVMGMVAKNTNNTTGLLMDLQGALDKLDPLSKARALEQMFGKFQFARMSALLNNLGKEGSQTLQVMDLMKASTSDLAGIAERELGMITESASGKYRKAMESLKAELASVGEEFLGVATKIINVASKILNFFTELPNPIKKALTFMAGFTALVGPLIMLTGVLANFFGYITKGIVQLRSFFMKANGWKMLTPEIIAAQKAAEMVENAFYSDAAAAQVLHNALQKLVLDYQNLQAASMKNAVPVNAGVSTVAGNTVIAAGRRVVDPDDPYVGDPNTRAMSHIRPRDINNPATIFGGVPGAIPVNRGISRTPQMYMHDRLPNIEGLTSVKGISTGIVSGEAAKFHALMATLGMQTEQEVATLKKTIAMGGTVSRELLDTFDDILPITQRFADSAATQSALIVQQMRNAEITVDQAKARILALNAQIESDMGSAVSLYAASRGRSIDLTRAPMMDQPVVDANGQFTLRDLYKKKTNASVMEEFGRLRGVRTFGAPYSIQTTRLPKFYEGGEIESFGPGKTMVSGPSSINYDDRLGSVPLGGYVLNQEASMDPANAALVAMAPSTYLNDGGNITAALTPREVVFGPQIQRMPELYAAVDAANSGYSFGGQIMQGVNSYGKQMSKSAKARMKEENFKRQYREYLKFINNPRYEDDIRIRMIMLDAAELSYHNKLPIDKAINIATSNFDKAKAQSGGSDENFVKIRIKQVQGLERDGMVPRVKNAAGFEEDGKTVYPRSSSKALNYQLNDVREAMLNNKKFAGVHDLIAAIAPTTFLNDSDGSPSIGGLHDKAHFRRKDLVGYTTSGYMGVGAVIPAGINNIMSTLETIGLSRDVLNLSSQDAKSNLAMALKKTGLDKFASVDDIFAALQDDGKIKSKADWESGRVVRANKDQKNSLRMLLEAAAKRSKWILGGRPPRPMLVSGAWNAGGMIPGGHISRNRSNYGNISPAIKLLAPDKQLKILGKARELSSKGSLGKFADMPVTEYGHQISASSGMSYPIPGVSGLYKNSKGKKVFVKGVPNELTAVHEPIGTLITRELFGIHSPEQRVVTVGNPVDPTKKSKLLALESDFDPRFANTNVPWDEDTVVRQLANSLLLNNKDLSRGNVYGNFNPDVGQAGVLPKASGNTSLADEMNSMEKQALINLLAVRGGARKDFARDTAPIVAKMNPKKYGRMMKKTLENARPKLVKIINDLPEDLKPPYIKMLARLDEGIDVDWSKYHAVHANPKYLNDGGPVGGGPVKRGRHAYGPRKNGPRKGAQRPGNPAARAAWEAEQRAQRERDLAAERSRAASHQINGQQALTSGIGREAVRTGTTSFYNPGQVMLNNMMDPFKNSVAMKAQYLSAAFSSVSTAISRGAIKLQLDLMAGANKIGRGYTRSSEFISSHASRAQESISRFRNSVIEQQNAYASRNYPVGQVPAQGFFGPGLIGKYKDVGDGIQSRKVGSLGFRKTEYLINDESSGQRVNLTAKQAAAAGIAIPKKSGMGYGAQMGIGMAGSMAGMGMMSQEKVLGMSGMQAGMAVMAASSILPFLPFARMGTAAKSGVEGVTKAVRSLATGAASAAKVVASLARFAKAFGPIGIAISGVLKAFDVYKGIKDSRQDATMGLSLTAKAAEQAGIKYFNLNEEMKSVIESRKLLSAAATGGEGLSAGLPGIAMSVKEMKEAKEEGKKLKEFIESLNRSSGFDETLRLVTNQKAQFVAAGMSIEEANKKIYGGLANSSQSADTFKILSNQTFAGITDKASAANFAVGNLLNTLSKGKDYVDFGREIGAGFEGLINIFNLTTQSIVGTKDELGNVLDQYDAYKQVMTDFQNVYGNKMNSPIGEAAYNELSRSNMLLGEMTTKADSIAGIIAKWSLFASGFKADLSLIDSDLAIKLAGFTTSLQGAVTDIGSAGGNASTFATVQTQLTKLQKTIAATSAASQRANASAQRSAQEELKLIAKKIKLIDDEKNKKLESLRATRESSNYALELQKLQIEYADAISRGDMAAANRAQLDIDQLTLNRQTDLAEKAIEDAANKKKAPLEKDAQRIQDAADKRSNDAAAAADNSAAAKEIASTLETYQKRYNDLTVEAINVKLLPPEQQRAAQAEVDRKIFALIKEVQKTGTGTSATAKAVRDGFAQYFDKSGKALELQRTSTEYVGSTLSEVKTVNKKILEIFQDDASKVLAQAEAITGGTTLKKLRDDMVAALLRYRPNTPEGTASGEVNQPGTAKDYSAKKSLNQAGAEAAKPPTLGGSAEKYTRLNNDGMEETFTIFTYKNKSYVVDTGGNIYKYDYGAQTIVDLDKKPVGRANAKAMGGIVKSFNPGGKVSGPGTATSDSIPAMLSDGEYVFSARAVDNAGGPEVVDNWHKALRRADGGPIYSSWKKPKSYYNSKNEPTGSPYGRYWGELERLYQGSPLGFDKNGRPIFNNAGKDPWGGVEIPGLPFNGKVGQFSDYWHQLTEQLRKSRGPGMGIDKDPMRYAGSGASMGGIGNGAYGFGPLMLHKGGPVGHRHGRNLPETQEQKAKRNKNLSYYESNIDDPIKNYSEGFGKVFTRSPFGIFATLTALASDLAGTYFQGKTPSFGKDGIGKALNPTSYQSGVSGLMQAMFHPFAEIAKGSATKGDWANAGLNFVPGAGVVAQANKLRVASSAYKALDKASLALPTEARVSLLPNSVLRNNFVALKKEGDLNSPEFAKARYELALSDAIRAAKRNKFTSLPDLKNTTAANLIEENKNLPKVIEEPIKVQGKDYIFRFEKADILPTDAPYIDKFIAGLKEGRVTSEGFGAGGMHQVEILDPVTRKQMSWINYDPVTGHISYRGTHPEYRHLQLSRAVYDKAVSITRIKHSPTLTDMGRPSALRIGGFMADDPYYGASTSLTGFKQYIDTLMKIKKSKKPKPSTGEARTGIGSWANNHTPSDQPSQPISSSISTFDHNRFNDPNSIIGAQNDRIAFYNDELRNSLRPETVQWFGSIYRTSENFPYGPNGYIEPTALPELERIIAEEAAARARQAGQTLGRKLLSGEAYLDSLRRGNGGYANGGLVQNFSNFALSNLGVPQFKDGINTVPMDMLALIHKNEAVVPANMNPFNPNATGAATGSVYNINVELNGTNVTAQDVATQIHREMRLKEMAAGVTRKVGG